MTDVNQDTVPSAAKEALLAGTHRSSTLISDIAIQKLYFTATDGPTLRWDVKEQHSLLLHTEHRIKYISNQRIVKTNSMLGQCQRSRKLK